MPGSIGVPAIVDLFPQSSGKSSGRRAPPPVRDGDRGLVKRPPGWVDV